MAVLIKERDSRRDDVANCDCAQLIAGEVQLVQLVLALLDEARDHPTVLELNLVVVQLEHASVNLRPCQRAKQLLEACSF